MELDTKQKVLLALYTEYQKDIPEMDKNVKPEILGIERRAFGIALEKLQNEGFIKDVDFSYGGNEPHPMQAWLNQAKMTRFGVEYVENKMDIDPTLNGSEKAKEIGKKAASFGFEQLKDISAKVIAEIAGKAMGVN